MMLRKKDKNQHMFDYVEYISSNNLCKQVIFSDKAINCIISQTLIQNVNETGGVFLGYILNGIWYVLDVIDAGINTENTQVHFVWDQAYVNHLVENQKILYKYIPTILGFYHRHPGSLDKFSIEDMLTMRSHLEGCKYGLLSGLVNIDPDLRLTLYFAESNKLMRVGYDIGNSYFPKELLEFAEPSAILKRFKHAPKAIAYEKKIQILKKDLEEMACENNMCKNLAPNAMEEKMKLTDVKIMEYVESLDAKICRRSVLVPESLMRQEDYTGPLYGYIRKDSGKNLILGYGDKKPIDVLEAEEIGYAYALEGSVNCNYDKDFILKEKDSWKYWDCEKQKFEDLEVEAYSLIQNVFSRNSGLLETDKLADATVLISGVGSVGSLIALQLARSGIGNFILMDDDLIEIHNVCRHQCGLNDVGRYKVDAISDKIHQINPLAKVTTFRNCFQDVEAEKYIGLINNDNSIMIAAADNRLGNACVSDIAFSYGIPFASMGFLSRAWACEIFTCLPEKSDKCYRCTFEKQVKDSAISQHNKFYIDADDMNEMRYEPGLDVDIEAGVSFFNKIILDILNRKDSHYQMRVYDKLTSQYTMISGTGNIQDPFWKRNMKPFSPVSIDVSRIKCSCKTCITDV